MKKISRTKALAISVFLGAVTGVFRGVGAEGRPSAVYYILFILSAALIGGFAYLAGSAPSPKQQRVNDVFKTAVVTAAFGTAAAGFFSFNAREALAAEPIDLLAPACMVFAFIAALSMIFSVASKDGETSSIMTSVPIFYAGALLLFFYKEHAAANPHVHAFATEIIAAAMAAVAAMAVGTMRFGGKSKSPVITFSILGAAASSACLISGAAFGAGCLSLPRLAAVTSIVVYSAAWYLFPPSAYVRKGGGQTEENRDDVPNGDSFFDVEKAEPVIPDADTIINEIKNGEAPEENDPEI